MGIIDRVMALRWFEHLTVPPKGTPMYGPPSDPDSVPTASSRSLTKFHTHDQINAGFKILLFEYLQKEGFVLSDCSNYEEIVDSPELRAKSYRISPKLLRAVAAGETAGQWDVFTTMSVLSAGQAITLLKIIPWLKNNPWQAAPEIIYSALDSMWITVNGYFFHIRVSSYSGYGDFQYALKNNKYSVNLYYWPSQILGLRDWFATYPPAPRERKDKPQVAVMVQRPDGGLATKTVSLNNVKSVLRDSDLDLYYGTGMLEFHKDLMGRLKKEHGGLTILHGDPGGGKTSYIRHLMKSLTGKKQLVLLPKGVLEVLGTPRFVEFLIDLSSTPSVLVIEDAEDVVMTGSRAAGSATSTLLNLTDGILNDISSVQVLITFNCPVSKVDPALMRSGRLTAKRDFGALSVADAIRLAEAKGLVSSGIKKPTMLCDVLCSPPVSSAASTGRSSTTGTATLGFVR